MAPHTNKGTVSENRSTAALQRRRQAWKRFQRSVGASVDCCRRARAESAAKPAIVSVNTVVVRQRHRARRPNPCADVAISPEISQRSRVSAACSTPATIRAGLLLIRSAGRDLLLGPAWVIAIAVAIASFSKTHSARLPQAFLQMFQYDRQDLLSGRLRRTDLAPAELRERDQRAVTEALATGVFQPYEKEFLRKDGSRFPVLI
jgi:PAS domain-containing protein